MKITLLDGTQADTNNINFDPGSYHFYYGDADVTNLIRRADKNNNWSNFDPDSDNLRLYNEANAPKNAVDIQDTEGAGTSTLGNFWDQITTDPLAAPLDAADAAIKKVSANTLKSVFGSVTGWLILGAVGLFLYLKFRK